jgi:hypothetical protein
MIRQTYGGGGGCCCCGGGAAVAVAVVVVAAAAAATVGRPRGRQGPVPQAGAFAAGPSGWSLAHRGRQGSHLRQVGCARGHRALCAGDIERCGQQRNLASLSGRLGRAH